MSYKPKDLLTQADNCLQWVYLWSEKLNDKELNKFFDLVLEARKATMAALSEYYKWSGVKIDGYLE